MIARRVDGLGAPPDPNAESNAGGAVQVTAVMFVGASGWGWGPKTARQLETPVCQAAKQYQYMFERHCAAT